MFNSDAKTELLTRAVDTILPTTAAFEAAMDKAEASGTQLRGYLGIDPTSPHLHIGHSVALRNLARFQQAGHKAILLIGDFTARLGDPDKLSTRQLLTKEQTAENLTTYLDQVRTILDFDGNNPVEVRRNSEWSDPMTFEEVVKLAAHFTVQQMLERDMFQKRLKEERPISLSEFFYPLMQGYDAVALEADVQFGGTDQTFNMLAGRILNRVLANRDMFVVASPLLADRDGVKIGKTMGNAINLDNPPQELYGQMMSLPDEVIVPGFRLLTEVPLEEVAQTESELAAGANPMPFKKELARMLVEQFHGLEAAAEAEDHFAQTVQNKELPHQIEELVVHAAEWDLLDLLIEVRLVESKGEARRLIEQGAVEIDGQPANERRVIINPSIVLKVGKRRYAKIIVG